MPCSVLERPAVRVSPWRYSHCRELPGCHTHHTALHWTALHYTALHCTALHYTSMHCNTVQCRVEWLGREEAQQRLSVSMGHLGLLDLSEKLTVLHFDNTLDTIILRIDTLQYYLTINYSLSIGSQLSLIASLWLKLMHDLTQGLILQSSFPTTHWVG